MTKRWIQTKDASCTLYHEELDEIYHSRDGAISECAFVYLQPFLTFSPCATHKNWRVLDVGLGLGYNWLCYVHHALTHTTPEFLHITSIEKDHTLFDITLDRQQLGSHDILPEALALLDKLKKNKTVTHAKITAELLCVELSTALAQLENKKAKFDVILFDAFSPEKNSECWTAPVFEAVSRCCHNNTLLLTYSVARSVKDALTQTGFQVKKTPGFGRKREQLMGVWGDNPKNGSSSAVFRSGR